MATIECIFASSWRTRVACKQASMLQGISAVASLIRRIPNPDMIIESSISNG